MMVNTRTPGGPIWPTHRKKAAAKRLTRRRAIALQRRTQQAASR